MHACLASACDVPLCLVKTTLDESELIIIDDELKESRGIHVVKLGCMIFLRSSKTESHSIDESRCDYYDENIFMISWME